MLRFSVAWVNGKVFQNHSRTSSVGNIEQLDPDFDDRDEEGELIKFPEKTADPYPGMNDSGTWHSHDSFAGHVDMDAEQASARSALQL